jgi:hypothetical protein
MHVSTVLSPCYSAEHISTKLEVELSALNNHILYASISTIGDLREFMRWHVFAVWDFMSLLKALQIKLTGMQLPWQPPEDNASARLINDIVLIEETDFNQSGLTSSHLELYLDSMLEIEAKKSNFDCFIATLSRGTSVENALLEAEAPQFVQDFVCHTIDLAKFGSLAEISSAFVFGRESVIPSMFQKFLKNWGIEYSEAPQMHYYLTRHIEVDTNEHGPATITLLDNIINRHPNNGAEALESAREAVVKRIGLWDGIQSVLDARKDSSVSE